MNNATVGGKVMWLFLDINAFFASCEQQEAPALRGKPIIVVQTLTESACAIAASYPAKRLGITTGTLLREARRICPDVIPVQANHRLYGVDDLPVQSEEFGSREVHQFRQAVGTHFLLLRFRPRPSRPSGEGPVPKEASRIACDRNEEEKCAALAAAAPTQGV